jgi:DNA-binding NarL/FixJ family response regulator
VANAELPVVLRPLPFAAWSVDDELVVDEVLGGGSVLAELGITLGMALGSAHPLLAAHLREAAGGSPVRRRVTAGSTTILLDAHPRVDAMRGAIALALPVPTTAATRASLTARQLEVLHLLCLGLTSRAIAQRLWIAETTVENHLRVIFRRLRARTRAEAVSRAFRLGIVDPAELDAVDDVA